MFNKTSTFESDLLRTRNYCVYLALFLLRVGEFIRRDTLHVLRSFSLGDDSSKWSFIKRSLLPTRVKSSLQ